VDIKTGVEFWFTLPTPAQRHPQPYKQFLLTLCVIFPLTLLVPWVLRPLFQTIPVLGLPGVGNFIISTVIVGLMTYVIMPRYTHLVVTNGASLSLKKINDLAVWAISRCSKKSRKLCEK